MAAPEEFLDAANDFTDANRAIEHRIDKKRRGFGSRGNQNRRDAFDKAPNRRVVRDFSNRFDHQGRGHRTGGEGPSDLVRGVHAERLDALFQKFGADTGAQPPIAGDDKDGGHSHVRG